MVKSVKTDQVITEDREIFFEKIFWNIEKYGTLKEFLQWDPGQWE